MTASIAIIGSGPAALMVADVVSSAGHAVHIFEKRKGLGRKLLIAGSSGLNITNSLPVDEFAAHYTGGSTDWGSALDQFSPQHWISFIENEIRIGTFEGTSGRYFVETMKASRLLQAWQKRLADQGTRFHLEHELIDFECQELGKIALHFGSQGTQVFDAVCLCLGGASYEPTENPLHWPKIFTTKVIPFTPFTPSNVGYEVGWTPAFLKEAEGLPLKDIVLTTHKGKRQGELVITRYGIEGTPVYFVGTPGPALIDLKPGLTAEAVLGKLKAVKENLSPNRRIKKQLGLSPAAQALVFHLMPRAILEDRSLIQLAHTIKAFPIELLSPRPLEEAISSKGGVSMKALDERLMLKKYPGIFLAGEMLDWDAPTGGFLIQGCVTQGFCAGLGINHYLKSPRPTS